MRKRTQLDAEAVLAAATGVAFDIGLHAVSLQSVAARLKVPVRTVAQVHPDESALIATVFSTIATADLAEMRRLMLSTPSPVAQLAVLFQGLADGWHADSGAVWLESWSLGRHNRALGDAVRQQEAAWQVLIAGIVRRGVKSGDFLTVDPEATAAQIAAVMNGVNAYGVVGFGSDGSRLALLASAVRGLLGADLAFETSSVAVDRP